MRTMTPTFSISGLKMWLCHQGKSQDLEHEDRGENLLCVHLGTAQTLMELLPFSR